MNADQLIAATRARLEAQRGNIAQVADSAGVSYSWASKFAQGQIRNPTIRQLEALTAALDRLEAA